MSRSRNLKRRVHEMPISIPFSLPPEAEGHSSTCRGFLETPKVGRLLSTQLSTPSYLVQGPSQCASGGRSRGPAHWPGCVWLTKGEGNSRDVPCSRQGCGEAAAWGSSLGYGQSEQWVSSFLQLLLPEHKGHPVS